MKIAITGDFHFGFNEDAAEQAARVMQDASSNADALILAGDLFDSRVPRQETIFEAIKAFRQCQQAGGGSTRVFSIEGEERRPLEGHFPLLAIYGTHERRTKGLVNVIQLLDSAGILVSCHARKILLEKPSEDGSAVQRVVVQGLGGLPEEMAAKAIELMDFAPVKDAVNIFVFHQSLRELIPQDEDCLSAAELPEGFDLYVDGHIHWRQELKEAGRHLLLAGSTVVTQMKPNETNPKGYYLYDTERRKATFVQVPTRPFIYEEMAFDGASPKQVEEEVAAKLASILVKYPQEQPLVKLKLRGRLAQGFAASQVDVHPMERAYAGRLNLSIDREIGSLALTERIEKLRKDAARTDEKTSFELGMCFLKRRLGELGVTNEELAADLEDVFELLSTGQVDAAVDLLAPQAAKKGPTELVGA